MSFEGAKQRARSVEAALALQEERRPSGLDAVSLLRHVALLAPRSDALQHAAKAEAVRRDVRL